MPRMARPKSQQHDLKRDEILDIAAQCFASQSYPAASMNDIATAGGTSKARLYHYYESKEAILFDLLDRYTQRLLLLIWRVLFMPVRALLFLRPIILIMIMALSFLVLMVKNCQMILRRKLKLG
mgnify:CR=1 FL=1